MQPAYATLTRWHILPGPSKYWKDEEGRISPFAFTGNAILLQYVREGRSRAVADAVPHHDGVLRVQHGVLRALRLRQAAVVGAGRLPAGARSRRRTVSDAAVGRRRQSAAAVVGGHPPVQFTGRHVRQQAGRRRRGCGLRTAVLGRRHAAATGGRAAGDRRGPR